jgi:hypothetical protein
MDEYPSDRFDPGRLPDDPGATDSGNVLKIMLQAGLSASAACMGYLVMMTLVISAKGSCKDKGITSQSVLIAIAGGMTAVGVWKLKNKLIHGVSILDSMPQFTSSSTKPALQSQWESWLTFYVMAFVVVLGSGIAFIEFGALQPVLQCGGLEEAPPGTQPGPLNALFILRRVLYGVIFVGVLIPILIGMHEKMKWDTPADAAPNAGRFWKMISGAQTDSGGPSRAELQASRLAETHAQLGLDRQGDSMVLKNTAALFHEIGYNELGLKRPQAFAAPMNSAVESSTDGELLDGLS